MKIHIESARKLKYIQLAIFAICAFTPICTIILNSINLLLGKEKPFITEYPTIAEILPYLYISTTVIGYIALSAIAKNVTTRNIILALAAISLFINVAFEIIQNIFSNSLVIIYLLCKAINIIYIFVMCYSWGLIKHNNNISKELSRNIELYLIFNIIHAILSPSLLSIYILGRQVTIAIAITIIFIKTILLYKIYTSPIFGCAANDTEYYSKGNYFIVSKQLIYWVLFVVITIAEILIPSIYYMNQQ